MHAHLQMSIHLVVCYDKLFSRFTFWHCVSSIDLINFSLFVYRWSEHCEIFTEILKLKFRVVVLSVQLSIYCWAKSHFNASSIKFGEQPIINIQYCLLLFMYYPSDFIHKYSNIQINTNIYIKVINQYIRRIWVKPNYISSHDVTLMVHVT